MRPPIPETPAGTVIVNFNALIAVSAEYGMSVEDVLRKSTLDHRTKERIRTWQPIRRCTFATLLGVIGPQNYGRIVYHGAAYPNPTVGAGRQKNDDELLEWIEPKYLTDWITLPNGLQYWVSRNRHRHLPDTFARVKCYELTFLTDDQRQEFETRLTRHPMVCRRLTPHPRIPVNQGAFPDPTGKCWWVIDYWIDGISLRDALQERLFLEEILRIGREIAEGLKLLHDNGIVRRGLSPQHILLRASDRSVVLTDFELAKLLDGAPTVGKDWPADPYRAPELGNSEATIRVDVYSWGRIMTQMICGVLPPVGREKKSLQESSVPESLIDLIVCCVSVAARNRPESMQKVLDALDEAT